MSPDLRAELCALLDHWTATGADAAAVGWLVALTAHTRSDGTCVASQARLADIFGVSRTTAGRAMAGLASLRLPDGRPLVTERPLHGCRVHAYSLAAPSMEDLARCAESHAAEGADPHTDRILRNPESLTPFSSSTGGNGSRNAIDKGREEAAPNPAAKLPADWQPSAADFAWAADTRPDVDPHGVTARFVAWCRNEAGNGNGWCPPDPSAIWRRFLATHRVARRPPTASPSADSHADVSSAPSDTKIRHVDHRLVPRASGRSANAAFFAAAAAVSAGGVDHGRSGR